MNPRQLWNYIQEAIVKPQAEMRARIKALEEELAAEKGRVSQLKGEVTKLKKGE